MDDGTPLEADTVPVATRNTTDRQCPMNDVVPSGMGQLSDKCFEEVDDELAQRGIRGFVTEAHRTFLRDPMVSASLQHRKCLEIIVREFRLTT